MLISDKTANLRILLCLHILHHLEEHQDILSMKYYWMKCLVQHEFWWHDNEEQALCFDASKIMVGSDDASPLTFFWMLWLIGNSFKSSNMSSTVDSNKVRRLVVVWGGNVMALNTSDRWLLWHFSPALLVVLLSSSTSSSSLFLRWSSFSST